MKTRTFADKALTRMALSSWNTKCSSRASSFSSRARVPGPWASALRCALGDLEGRARDHGVNAAAHARGLLAVRAMAGTQLRDRGIDGVADGAAEAASGERGGASMSGHKGGAHEKASRIIRRSDACAACARRRPPGGE